MVFNVIITEPANDDLEEIVTYLSETLDNPSAADRLTERVDRVIDHLSIMPEMYDSLSVYEEQKKGLRKVPLGKYLMVFQIDEPSETVRILRFFHGTQDYGAML